MNDLGISLSDLTGRGRRPSEVEASRVREITQEDMEALATLPRGVKAPERKRITERHHALARLLAGGMDEGVAATVLGYEPSTVSIIKASPAFQELMVIYTNARDVEFADTMAQMAGLTKDVLLEIRKRVEEEPEKIGMGMLTELLTKLTDRTGFGPTTKQEVNVNVGLGERLKLARERARSAMIDVTPEEE